jgi:hypothetical protein
MLEKLVRAGVIGSLIFVCAFAARAEIVKTAIPNCFKDKICFYWWPKLSPLPGWHTDQRANYANGDGNGVNTLVPDGSDFVNTDTVMYAQAVFKERYEARNPKSKTLEAFVADDRAAIAQDHNDMKIEEAAPLTTASGQKLRSLTYFRSGEWERVSYGEEGGYYLLFVINAQTESGYRANMPAYESLVRNYRE